MNASPVDKNNLSQLMDMKHVFQKYCFCLPIACRLTITLDNIAFKKPGTGICASKYQSILGKKLLIDIPSDHIFMEDDFNESLCRYWISITILYQVSCDCYQ